MSKLDNQQQQQNFSEEEETQFSNLSDGIQRQIIQQIESNDDKLALVNTLSKKVKCFCMVALIVGVLGWVALAVVGRVLQSQEMLTNQVSTEISFPKIIWLIQPYSHEAADLTTTLHFNNIRYFSNDFVIHHLTPNNFYDYLSESASKHITQIMQTKIQRYLIYELAILYLLFQNGGIYINHQHVILTRQIDDWLLKLAQSEEYNLKNFSTLQNQSKMFLFHREDQQDSNNRAYDSYFIAAEKQNHLIFKTINYIQSKLKNANQSTNFDSVRRNLPLRQNNEWIFFSRFIEQSLMSQLGFGFGFLKTIDEVARQFGLISKRESHPLNFDDLTRKTIEDMQNENGEIEMLYLNRWENAKLNIIERNVVIQSNQILQYNNESYLIQTYFKIPASWQMLQDKTNIRESRHFCIVSTRNVLTQSDQLLLQTSYLELTQQIYQNWTAIYFHKTITQVKIVNSRIHIYPSEENIGKNAHAAFMNYCPLSSIILLLDFNEKLTSSSALSTLSAEMKDKFLFGVLLSLTNANNQIFFNSTGIENFKRHQYFKNYHAPNFKILQNIYHHFRVFDSNLYRVLPNQDLNEMQVFYENKLSFLVGILSLRQYHNDLFLQKKYYHRFNFPKKLASIQKPMIKVISLELIDMKEVPAIGRKTAYLCFADTLRYSEERGVPLSRYLPEGKTYSFINKSNNSTAERIPKIIHYIWIGSSAIPAIRQEFQKQTRKSHPNYEMKVWKKEDISRQNFPFMYDLLMQLMEVDKLVPQRKEAEITDLMRFQILYHHGGFYLDTNLELFRPSLHRFLHHKLFIVAEQSTTSTISQNMCIFGVQPHSQHMLRLILPRNTNKFDFYDPMVTSITGPQNFRQVLTLEEEYDANNIVLPFELFFPFFPWVKVKYQPGLDIGKRWEFTDSRFNVDKCVANGNQVSMQKIEFAMGIKVYLSKCEEKYPFSFGMEHYGFGGNWLQMKPTHQLEKTV